MTRYNSFRYFKTFCIRLSIAIIVIWLKQTHHTFSTCKNFSIFNSLASYKCVATSFKSAKNVLSWLRKLKTQRNSFHFAFKVHKARQKDCKSFVVNCLSLFSIFLYESTFPFSIFLFSNFPTGNFALKNKTMVSSLFRK